MIAINNFVHDELRYEVPADCLYGRTACKLKSWGGYSASHNIA